MLVLGLTALLSHVLHVSAELLDHPSQLTTKTYDYVIVGGGTAGNVVASRLSENPTFSVLVLEAGVDGSNDINLQVPLFGPVFAVNTPYDWNYTTVTQPGLSGRSIPYARGRVMGGSSTINFMVYNRGSIDDWNGYAAITKDNSFKWNAMKKYMKKNELWGLPEANRSINGEYISAAHSSSGLLGISLPEWDNSLDGRVIKATEELSAEFPFQQDMNAGNPIGVGWAQSSVLDGVRTDSNNAYISKFLRRPNLTVLTNAQVTRILKTGTTNGRPVFRGVEFAPNSTAPRVQVTALKEVILAAGSFNTPHLLMLSGIGDRAELAKVGIQPILDLPSVGKNMSDHTLLGNIFEINDNVTDTLQDYWDTTNLGTELSRWSQNHTGPLTDTGNRQIGWLRLPETDPIFQAYKDPTFGMRSAHFELVFAHGLFPGQNAGSGKYMSIITNLISPIARGNVSLASADPFTLPLINPNLLGSPFDAHVLVYALKAIQRYVKAKALSDYVVGRYGAFAEAGTDEELEAYARANAGTVWHAVGTASVSPRDAPWGVVDPDLTVKKTVGLSVVDAASIPYVPSAHTQGPVYFWAERAADVIKARA